jgi:hypothetical protein
MRTRTGAASARSISPSLATCASHPMRTAEEPCVNRRPADMPALSRVFIPETAAPTPAGNSDRAAAAAAAVLAALDGSGQSRVRPSQVERVDIRPGTGQDTRVCVVKTRHG